MSHRSGVHVPGDRRLKEEAIAFDQVGQRLPAGTKSVLDLFRTLGDDRARGRTSRLEMDELGHPDSRWSIAVHRIQKGVRRRSSRLLPRSPA